MIFKGTNPSPVYINKERSNYSVSVYSSTKIDDHGIIEHHFKTFRTKYQNFSDAESAGWHYINSRETMQAWRGSIRSFDEALAK
tara:strand:+ start:52836 stop:53087 length:252 start_codon:yes stop_codon:yes gene_type:complete